MYEINSKLYAKWNKKNLKNTWLKRIWSQTKHFASYYHSSLLKTFFKLRIKFYFITNIDK